MQQQFFESGGHLSEEQSAPVRTGNCSFRKRGSQCVRPAGVSLASLSHLPVERFVPLARYCCSRDKLDRCFVGEGCATQGTASID
jgi:hypothetical protein